MTKRMTVCLGTAITSVTINDGIFELLSLKLEASPEESMPVVRTWVQREIATHNRTLPGKLSQWVTFQAALFLTDDKTREAYYDGLKCDENDSSTIVPTGSNEPLETEPVESMDTTNKRESVPQSEGATSFSQDALAITDVCRLILDMRDKGNNSQQIADEFNDKGIRTKRTRVDPVTGAVKWTIGTIDQFVHKHKSKLDVG